jgi:DNA-binding HxlR family transcriptional regulator
MEGIMRREKNGRIFHCPVEAALDVIGGKWKPLILWHLMDNILRFSELLREIPGVNTKMLTKQLRELEEDGVIARKVYAEVPPRVEYRLTDFGRTLIPILNSLCEWGRQYLVANGGTGSIPPRGCTYEPETGTPEKGGKTRTRKL